MSQTVVYEDCHNVIKNWTLFCWHTQVAVKILLHLKQTCATLMSKNLACVICLLA